MAPFPLPPSARRVSWTQLAAGKVLFLERGDFEYARGYFNPPQVGLTPKYPHNSSSASESLPSPHVVDQAVNGVVGKVVWGGGVVDSQFFYLGSR